MPELPEVEQARRLLERHALGRVVRALRALHPALRRSLPPRAAARAVGRRIVRIERRAKHQLLHLDDGGLLHVHFRMSGDWLIQRAGDAVHPHARAMLELDDDTRISLVDPRALGTIVHCRAGAEVGVPMLGPEPMDPAFDGARLRASFATRRGAVKPALLDQRVVAGIGNIYAVEALWRARIDPRTPARTMRSARLERLAAALREVVLEALETPARYSDPDARTTFDVYDREGDRCGRCGRRIRRIAQAGRSTYFCSGCQT